MSNDKEKVFAVGFKGFDKDMKCHNKQYAENQVFEEKGGDICNSGVMHFCKVPMDVLSYYSPFCDNANDVVPNTFAKVEALADCQDKEDKSATTKIKIGAKINLVGLCKAQIEYVKEQTKIVCTAGDGAHSSTAGDGAHSSTAGNWAHSSTAGNWAHSSTSGYKAHSSTSGNWAHSSTSGYKAHSSTAGYKAHSSTAGDGAHSSTAGDGAHSSTAGNWAHSSTAGYKAHSSTAGYKAHSSTAGDGAHSSTAGDGAHSSTAGDGAHSSTAGKNSIAVALGGSGWAKSTKGNWLVLAEYDDNMKLLLVKTVKVDGEIIKENIFYTLKNGEFVEAESEGNNER